MSQLWGGSGELADGGKALQQPWPLGTFPSPLPESGSAVCSFFTKRRCEKGGSAAGLGWGGSRGCLGHTGFSVAKNRVSNLHLGRGSWHEVEF